jgi:hypothetical protein
MRCSINEAGATPEEGPVSKGVFTVRCRISDGIARMHEMMNSGNSDEPFDQCRAAPSTGTGATAVKKTVCCS